MASAAAEAREADDSHEAAAQAIAEAGLALSGDHDQTEATIERAGAYAELREEHVSRESQSGACQRGAEP